VASSLSVKYALNKVPMAVKNKKEKEVEKEQNENVSKKHDETVSEGSENQSDSNIKEEDGQTSR
jgi:hypothetical protein